MTHKTKTFDCIDMKRRIQEKIYEDTKGMTRVEAREYMRQRIVNSEFATFLVRQGPGAPSPGGRS